ncbi:hypothetical protein [Methanoregula formicica]|uniref:Uncharacterized protein n=1 Tax=Methanoregula formicica (strain DSM 22288 / NBRC 105244 / SMSP) TaxID=593750 RepID=L0HAT4_METFS|nr:hypothetical protein [Methanoregula formicica]AGB01857.1 hypothetical protein Metfor_0797 [Methanoregula formicica SMSP]
MDTPGNESGDAVIHRTQRLIINGIGYEAVFLEGRLVLVCEDAGKPRLEIPYQDITLASAETNRLREPVIRITYGTADGGMRGIELIFIFLAAGKNIQNRDRCLTVLEKQGVPVRPDPTPADYYSRARRERMDAGTLDTAAPTGRPAVPEWTVYGPAQGTRQALPDEPKPVSPAFTLVAIVLLAAILLVAMVSPIPEPGLQHWEKAAAAKAGVTATPTPAPVSAPAAAVSNIAHEPGQTIPDSVAEATLPPGAVPGNGIWVKIAYQGYYAGTLSAGGLQIDVNSSGTQIYQMPVHDTVIDIFVEKGDGSGEALEIGVYNGGEVVESDVTSRPRGALEMHVPVGPAIIRNATPVGPLVVTTIPETVAPSGASPVPSTGVFVRVLYPGQYTGTISANGFERAVNSSGEQIFQLSMAVGNIDAFLEKGDGSVRNILVEVYKNGNMVTSADTSIPYGVVEIHTSI